MKLKEARREAGKLGYRWVAVDEDKKVFAYKEPPHKRSIEWSINNADTRHIELGEYTGHKNWVNTRAKAIKPKQNADTYLKQAVEYSAALYAILADAELRDDYEVGEIGKIAKAALAAKHVESTPSGFKSVVIPEQGTLADAKKKRLANGFRLNLLSTIRPDVKVERSDDNVTWSSGVEGYKLAAERYDIAIREISRYLTGCISLAPSGVDNVRRLCDDALEATSRPAPEDT